MKPEEVYALIQMAEDLLAAGRQLSDGEDYEQADELFKFAIETIDKARDESRRFGVNFGGLQ
jgi:hypothetical protein